MLQHMDGFGIEPMNDMTEDRNNKSIARRSDWKTEPMPEQNETFILSRSFSDEEMDALRRGNVP